MKGFDYRTQQAVDRTPQEWARDLAAVLAAGGRRRVEFGETFAHSKAGPILFEVYGNVRAARRGDE